MNPGTKNFKKEITQSGSTVVPLDEGREGRGLPQAEASNIPLSHTKVYFCSNQIAIDPL